MPKNRRTVIQALKKRFASFTARFLAYQLRRYGRTTVSVGNRENNTKNPPKLNEKIGIVFQGPIKTKEDLEYIRHSIENLKNVVDAESIIVSTWREPKQIARELEDICHVVQNVDSSKLMNSERQMISALAGIDRLAHKNVDFVAKLRVDQRFDWHKTFTTALSLLRTFGENRIIFASNNSFKYRPFGLSDMFTFGKISNSRIFWDALDCPKGDSRELTFKYDFAPWYQANSTLWTESFLNINYALKKNFEFSSDIYLDYINYIRKYTCIIDSDNHGHNWRKLKSHFQGSTEKMLFNRHHPITIQEWSFLDWFRIYENVYTDTHPEILF